MKTKYIYPLQAYLRGEQEQEKNRELFCEVLKQIQAELDEYDNSEKLYFMYIRILNKYFETEVQPKMTGKLGEVFLLELVVQWDNYTIFSFLLNRLFGYLNRNYLNDSQHKPKLGLKSQMEFKNRVITGLEDQLFAAISDQITRDRN